NITLATTQWVVQDETSDIKKLLSLLSYEPQALYTSFSFASAEIEVLKKYDEGEAKEGVGAGASLGYAHTHGVSNEKIVENIELMMYEMM
ncbi:MAG: nicotinate-nucleotide--dimethylbenzimidazole phosphoribosyltransferase, partial [Epsilonproteobacteria bacterium]|nr:nicotinate-nucleotide--dimethylbenzimidazole phosphoribosyltransferase [Campylobacterota bacterium]